MTKCGERKGEDLDLWTGSFLCYITVACRIMGNTIKHWNPDGLEQLVGRYWTGLHCMHAHWILYFISGAGLFLFYNGRCHDCDFRQSGGLVDSPLFLSHSSLRFSCFQFGHGLILSIEVFLP